MRGFTIIELVLAIVILAVGVLAATNLLPVTARSAQHDRMVTQAAGYAQQKVEELRSLDFYDSALSQGTHPASPESIDVFQREYQVTDNLPMTDMKQVVITVSWRTAFRASNVQLKTYIAGITK